MICDQRIGDQEARIKLLTERRDKVLQSTTSDARKRHGQKSDQEEYGGDRSFCGVAEAYSPRKKCSLSRLFVYQWILEPYATTLGKSESRGTDVAGRDVVCDVHDPGARADAQDDALDRADKPIREAEICRQRNSPHEAEESRF